MTLEEFALQTNMDLEEVLARFAGMESLVSRFIKKFPGDPSFSQLQEAVAAGDYDTAEKAAHTLKGVAGNLGFSRLFELNQLIVDAVRQGRSEDVQLYFEQDRVEYEKVIQAIGELA